MMMEWLMAVVTCNIMYVRTPPGGCLIFFYYALCHHHELQHVTRVGVSRRK